MHPRKQPSPGIRKAPQFRSDANRKADQGTGGRVVRRVTIAQVAEEAGVSAMTVSNVLNGKPGAAEDTRRRVLEVAGRLGYQPNVSARNLRAGRSGLIGVMALDLTNQYGLEIVRGVADALAEAERELLINATYQDAIRERERIEFLGRGLVDGVLLVAPVLEDQALEALARANLPCVIIDPRRLDVPFPRVTVDNYHGMRAAAQHLLDLGHTKIAYICGEPDMESTAVRFQGYSDAMRLAGVEVDERLVAACDFSYACGFRMRLPTELMKRGSTAAPRTPVAPGAPGVGRPGRITFPGDGPDVVLHQTRRGAAPGGQLERQADRRPLSPVGQLSVKDERGSNDPDTDHKHIMFTTFERPGGPFCEPAGPVSPALAEGPSFFRSAGEWVQISDHFTTGRYGAASSADGLSWRPCRVSMPAGARRASVLDMAAVPVPLTTGVPQW
jgi:transcriptional regulator with XRE-family HTH domain